MASSEPPDELIQVLTALRGDHRIDEQLAQRVNRRPHIYCLRSQITASDIDALLHLARSDSPARRGLAVSLMSNVEEDERVREVLRTLWTTRTDFATRNRVMWRLLDYPDLDMILHRIIWAFVREHWSDWLQAFAAFCGGKSNVMGHVCERLADPTFPETKKWAYLCGSTAAGDTPEMRALLASYQGSRHSIVAEVVSWLLTEQISNNGHTT